MVVGIVAVVVVVDIVLVVGIDPVDCNNFVGLVLVDCSNFVDHRREGSRMRRFVRNMLAGLAVGNSSVGRLVVVVVAVVVVVVVDNSLEWHLA